MKQYRDQVMSQIADLETQIKTLSAQIDQAYSHLETETYYLHAICVHDGNAESGHYYTFIKDHNEKKWRNYNDIRVTDVDEDTVFEHANGSSGFKTAYWVVYVNKATFQQA